MLDGLNGAYLACTLVIPSGVIQDQPCLILAGLLDGAVGSNS